MLYRAGSLVGMPYVLVRHKVVDYKKWRSVFDEHGSSRRAYWSRGGFLFRSADDPNEMVIPLEYKDLEKARQFAQSQDLKDVMERAGVADMPDIYYLEEVDRPRV